MGPGTYCQRLSSNPHSAHKARVRVGHPADLAPGADYKRFNSSNVSIRPWSWNYRSCWHQTCPPVGTHHCVWIASIPSSTSCNASRIAAVRRCLTDRFLYWAICAPAARLGSGSRFSGSLSGIEPLFPVTRENHGRPLSYHRKLIGQKFE